MFLRKDEGEPETGPHDVGQLMILWKGGDLPPTAQVRHPSVDRWQSLPDFLERWKKGMREKGYR